MSTEIITMQFFTDLFQMVSWQIQHQDFCPDQTCTASKTISLKHQLNSQTEKQLYPWLNGHSDINEYTCHLTWST